MKNTDFFNKSVLFYDRNAEYIDWEYKFLKFFKAVYIYTDLPQKYESIAEKSLKKYGNTPIVKLFENRPTAYDFKVDFFNKTFSIFEKNTTYNFLDFNDNNIVVPKEITNCLPKNVNLSDFCCGILKYYNFPQLNNAFFNL